MTIKHFLSIKLSGREGRVKICDKMAISSHILKIVENDSFLMLQMTAKKMFNRHHFFIRNKQYAKIKLMKNETNLWSSFLATHISATCIVIDRVTLSSNNLFLYNKLIMVITVS